MKYEEYKLVIDGWIQGYGSHADLLPEYRKWIKVYDNVVLVKVK